MAFLTLFFRENSKQTCLQPDSGVYTIETSEARPPPNWWESLNDGNTNLLAAGFDQGFCSSNYNIRVDPSADSQVGGGNKTKATTARRYRDESREVVSSSLGGLDREGEFLIRSARRSDSPKRG
jgi:hypothetical protein